MPNAAMAFIQMVYATSMFSTVTFTQRNFGLCVFVTKLLDFSEAVLLYV